MRADESSPTGDDGTARRKPRASASLRLSPPHRLLISTVRISPIDNGDRDAASRALTPGALRSQTPSRSSRFSAQSRKAMWEPNYRQMVARALTAPSTRHWRLHRQLSNSFFNAVNVPRLPRTTEPIAQLPGTRQCDLHGNMCLGLQFEKRISLDPACPVIAIGPRLEAPN